MVTSAVAIISVATGRSGVRIQGEVTPQPEELLSNPGFEDPAIESATQLVRPQSWVSFTSGTPDWTGVSSVTARSGKQAAWLVSHDVPNFFQGIYQALPVTSGTSYQFSAYVRNDPARPLKGTSTGQLSIEWHDANQNEIGRLWGTTWGASLPATEWTRFELSGAAPSNSAIAHFVIVQKGEGQPVAGGAFLVDDASVVRVP
jgi:hypothetical protein